MAHEHDPNLIAAIAEGRSPEVEADLADCRRCTADLAAQRAALAAMTSAAPIALSEIERSEMRRSIADALGLAEPEPVTPVKQRRRMPWGPLAVAAASLVAIVMVVPTLSLLSANDGDTSATDPPSVATEAPTTIGESRIAERRTDAGNEADMAATTTTAPASLSAAPDSQQPVVLDDATLDEFVKQDQLDLFSEAWTYSAEESTCPDEIRVLAYDEPRVRQLLFEGRPALLVVDLDEGIIQAATVLAEEDCSVLRTIP